MCTATRAPNLLWIAHWVTSIFPSVGAPRLAEDVTRSYRLFPPGSDAAFMRLTPIERLGAFYSRVALNWTNRARKGFAVAYTSSFPCAGSRYPSKDF